MHITKIDGSKPCATKRELMTPQEFQMEVSYFKSHELLRKLLKANLISQEEHDEINKLNMVVFRPLQAHLWP